MSGVISYELFNSKLGTSGSGFTDLGGYFEIFINNTGTSVKGTIVVASTSVDDAVDIAPANTYMPIGVIYESGIANGNPVKVVVSGKAEALLKDGEAASNGYWCGVSDVAGRMYQLLTVPSVPAHNREIGHSIQAVASGTDVLAKIQIHAN